MMRATVPLDGRFLRLSLSIGLASVPGQATDPESLIAAADAAMYRVKPAFRGEPALAG